MGEANLGDVRAGVPVELRAGQTWLGRGDQVELVEGLVAAGARVSDESGWQG